MYFSITVTVLQNNIFYVHPVDLFPFFFYSHISELVSQCSEEKEVCIKSDYMYIHACLHLLSLLADNGALHDYLVKGYYKTEH